MPAPGKKVVITYILILAAHLGHVTEEILGQFFLIEKFGGLSRFVAINIVLFGIVIFLFVYTLKGKRWACILSILYAGVMIINGLGHNIATIVTGEYYDGYAGGFSGIALIIIGPFLIYYLRKGLNTDG